MLSIFKAQSHTDYRWQRQDWSTCLPDSKGPTLDQAQKEESWKYLNSINDNHRSEEEYGMKQRNVNCLNYDMYFILSDILVLVGIVYR